MGTNLLVTVENFLLPRIESLGTAKSNRDAAFESSPRNRLNHLLYEIALADHIRSLQTIYRDSDDEQRLGADFLNQGVSDEEFSSNAKLGVDDDVLFDPNPNLIKNELPTKLLIEKMAEGRARAYALCRLCYGEDSIESLKATIDLANTYALQGSWPQVAEHMSVATQKLQIISAAQQRSHTIDKSLMRSIRAATMVQSTFLTLREHAVKCCGQVTKAFIAEVVAALSPHAEGEGSDGSSSHPYNISSSNMIAEQAQLATSLHNFFARYECDSTSNASNVHAINHPKINADTEQRSSIQRSSPSWGEAVAFLREECPIMSQWVQAMEGAILPQNRAILLLPFRKADQQARGVAHPAQLSRLLSSIPSVTRTIAGSGIAKSLQQMKIEVPLMINAHTGEILDIAVVHGSSSAFDDPQRRQDNSCHMQYAQRVTYELPITWEEFLSLVIIELDNRPLDVLRCQVYTLSGVCQIFTGKMTAAEESLRKALKLIEGLGLEMETSACDLYNSIAQMMIMKYRQGQSDMTTACKKEALTWLSTEEGRRQQWEQMNRIKAQNKDKNLNLTMAEIEMRAKNAVVRSRTKENLLHGDNPSIKAVEAAYRYLVRSFEILENVHGPFHPTVGAACLAVASVHNIEEKYEEAREWLVRSLRKMEKLNPVPVRAIAFVQIQLSQILFKQGHIDEAQKIISQASLFYTAKVKEGIKKHESNCPTIGNIGSRSIPISAPHALGKQVLEDAKAAIDVNTRLISLYLDSGNKWAAAEKAEANVILAESVYGWDHQDMPSLTKIAAERFLAVGDWGRAVSNLKKSWESCEVVFGKADKRTIHTARLLQYAIDKKKKMFEEASSLNFSARGDGDVDRLDHLADRDAQLISNDAWKDAYFGTLDSSRNGFKTDTGRTRDHTSEDINDLNRRNNYKTNNAAEAKNTSGDDWDVNAFLNSPSKFPPFSQADIPHREADGLRRTQNVTFNDSSRQYEVESLLDF